MHSKTVIATLVAAFGASAIAAPTANTNSNQQMVVRIRQANVAQDKQVSDYIGKGGVYATFKQGAQPNLVFTKDAKKAEKFVACEQTGALLKSTSGHGSVATTAAPQGFGGVVLSSTPNKDLAVYLTEPGQTPRLTDSEAGFKNWMFCFTPDSNSLSWTKEGFNLEQYNKDLPNQGKKGYHCALVDVEVANA